ncbi:MAG: DUF5123 domain-containing protein, partial [Prevotella sp.]|nr:DUF5123 domain-containing protein [Prevotella sp.]
MKRRLLLFFSMLTAMLSVSLSSSAQDTSDFDMTSLVKTDAWSWNSGGEYGAASVTTADGRTVKMMERYYGQLADNEDQPLKQIVTGLEDGNYTVSIYAKTNCANWSFEANPDFVDGSYEYAGVYAIGDVKNATPIEADIARNYARELKSYSIDVKVVGGTLEIGLELYRKDMTNWHTIQIKSLVWHATAEEYAAYKQKLIAANAALVAGASTSNPVVAPFLVNGTFDNTTAPWASTTGAQNQTLANNQQGAFTGKFYENWNGSPYTGKLYQIMDNVPNGLYKLEIAAFVNTLANPNDCQYVYANNDKTFLTTGEPTKYEVWTLVKDNKLEVGFEQTTAVANWVGIDNVNLYYYGEEQPVMDIEISPASGADIYAEYAAAKANLKDENGVPAIAGGVIINLAEGGSYTISGSLETSSNFLLNGNKATIEASGLGNNAFVLMGANPVIEEGNNGQIIDVVSINNVTINNLPSYLYYDNGKKWIVNDFTLDNCVIKMDTSDPAVKSNAFINGYGYGFVSTLISNSTIYNVGEAASAPKYLIRFNNSARADRMGAERAYVIVRNNTFYNILNGDGQFANYDGMAQQKTTTLTLKDNIFVGIKDVARRFIKGYSSNPTYEIGNNTYMLADGTFDNQSNYDKSGTAIECNPNFANAANGNFTVASDAEQTYYKTGDPRWLTEEYTGPILVNDLAALKAIELGAAGLAVKVKVADAKVTALAENQMGFMEDATAAVMIAFDEPVEGVAKGNALTGSITGGYMDMGGTGAVLVIDSFKGTTKAVDVTKGAEIVELTELAQPFNANRLVTIANSKSTPIVNDGAGSVTVGGFLVTNEVLCEAFEYPANIDSITGIVMIGGMFGEDPVIVVRGAEDVVAGLPEGVLWMSDVAEGDSVAWGYPCFTMSAQEVIDAGIKAGDTFVVTVSGTYESNWPQIAIFPEAGGWPPLANEGIGGKTYPYVVSFPITNDIYKVISQEGISFSGDGAYISKVELKQGEEISENTVWFG